MNKRTNLWRLALNTIMKPVAGYRSDDIKAVGESLMVSEHGSDNISHAVGESILKIAHLMAFAEMVFEEVTDADDG